MQNTKWQSLFTRFGFDVTEEDMYLNVGAMNKDNIQLLETVLKQVNASFLLSQTELQLFSDTVTVEEWILAQDQHTNGRTEMLHYFEHLPLAKVDVYIAGLVTQFNKLGFATNCSCDGHNKTKPYISFCSRVLARKAAKICESMKLPVTLDQSAGMKFQVIREKLPTFAEKLSEITKEEVKELVQTDSILLPKEEYLSQLETCLNIPGASGNEGEIRNWLSKELHPYIDHISVDGAGNLLAIQKFGPGPTILLNAHLDTVLEIEPNRTVLKNEHIWTSSQGILGADDRAGINVVLSSAKTLTKKQFNGTIKYIFTVKEEIGLLGASAVHESFLWDVDMAFVVDRKNTSDIVISNSYGTPFCSKEHARSLERIAKLEEFGQWKSTPGGSSDTAVWASHGIQSVNLSAGYNFEHTEREQLNVEANYETYKFLMTLIENGRILHRRVQRQQVV